MGRNRFIHDTQNVSLGGKKQMSGALSMFLNSQSSGQLVQVTGSQILTTTGFFSWQVPAGVTSISVVAVGGGASAGGSFGCSCITGYSGGGGALAYLNNIPVTPGQILYAWVGVGGNFSNNGQQNGGDTFLRYTITGTDILKAQGGGTAGGSYFGAGVLGGAGGSGGAGGGWYGGGGAGGYSGAGGNGGVNGPGSNGSGGGGAGGTATVSVQGAGGGVGLFGQGASGINSNGVGGGGSGGTAGGLSGAVSGIAGAGGIYGGGGVTNSDLGGVGGQGAIRIVWPGTSRQFPSTNVGTV